MKELYPHCSSLKDQEIESAESVFERRSKLLERAHLEHEKKLMAHAVKITGNIHDAKDIMQKLWLYVLRRSPEDRICSEGYLFLKVNCLWKDLIRSRVSKREDALEAAYDVRAPAGAIEAFSDEEEREIWDRFWNEYEKLGLSMAQKECLWLLARFGYTYGEISKRLDVPRSTVGDWIALARRRLLEHKSEAQGRRYCCETPSMYGRYDYLRALFVEVRVRILYVGVKIIEAMMRLFRR